MQRIRNAAFVSVGRACGFAGFAILFLMLGLSFDPPVATRAGGLSAAVLAAILFAYGLHAPKRPYKRTETWILLPKEDRPPDAVAQKVIGEELRQMYLWFARQAAFFAAVLLAASIVLAFI